MRPNRLTFAIAIAGPLALAGCADDTDSAAGRDTGSSEYVIDAESGEASMTIATPDGDASMRAGSGVKPDLPDGWTVYPGATITDSINVSGADGGVTSVTMTTDAAIEDVVDHYRRQASATGYAIEEELTTVGSTLVNGQNADGSTFSVSAVPGADGGPITVQLTMADGL